MSKFIVITGGVVSGLGKGITMASIGLLLKSSSFIVDAIKFDPYLNIDPGTMSPYEHGEVYVLDDGSETDLDLGHYERFLDVNLTKYSSVTAGKIYDAILNKERQGDYLGKNVQLIPHVTNYIKDCFVRNLPRNQKNHVRLIEIGGSTGDMEGEIFLEGFRQFKQENKGNVLHIHLGYVPFLDCSGEFKSKPLQSSIRQLLTSGLQPDAIVARYAPEKGSHLSTGILEKIALFSNLPPQRVISLPDVDSIYKVPGFLKDSKTIQLLEEFTDFKIEPNLPDFYTKLWQNSTPKKTVKIVLVAKYPKLSDAYLSLSESIKIAGQEQDVKVEIGFVEAESLEENADPCKKESEIAKLRASDGIIIPGGFGARGMEGKIFAINFARTNKIPFLGICLGLQMAVVEFARNVLGLKAYSSEMFDEGKADPSLDILIDLIPEQKAIHTKGGTMRLGGYDCWIEHGTLAKKLYKKEKTRERHRHRLEVQPQYVDKLEENGLKISGKHFYQDKEGNKKFLVELVEVDQKDHPYFIATQSHPEFLSRPNNPHPLFRGLIEASVLKQV
ncbi:MAG: CTP synthase [Flammeovirgaceae bacterium]